MKVVILTALLVALAECRNNGSYLPPSYHYLPTSQTPDQKHVYFYASPDRDQLLKFKINVVPSVQKQTKVIFVKAPSYNIIPEVVAPRSQIEDKTLVYVLSKNPQDGSITIPTSFHIKKTPPKVYFIKYGSKADAAASVSAGVQEHAVGSAVPNVHSEASFLSTIDSKYYGGYGHGNSYFKSSGPY